MTGYIFKCNSCDYVKVLWDNEVDVEEDFDCPSCKTKHSFVREYKHAKVNPTVNRGSFSYVMGKDRDRVREMKYNEGRRKRGKK